MALDRNNLALPYVTGRMIAICEHYAGGKFGPGTLTTMFSHPQHGVDVWRRYIDKNDEYYWELKEIALPVTTKNEMEKSQVWVGYYHQKAAYGDTTHGGHRPGSGRPDGNRKVQLSVRVSQEAIDKLNRLTNNKSEYIDKLIRQQRE